mmetsp:Transcript_77850/g.171907  ORF Transcript_77850/g.171907 Transcript_77850/m.171907 type:complete len:208 (+) Transcript_77850:62-685(+)
MRFYGLLPLLWLSQAARDAEDFEVIGSPEEDQQSSFAQRKFGHGHHGHHGHGRQMRHRLEDESESTPQPTEAPSETDAREEAPDTADEERLEIQSAAKKEPDDCGPLMGNHPAEVRAQVLRCLKQRKRQAGEVQETLQNRAVQERLLADESDKVEKLTKEIGDMNAMKAAYLNDEQIVKGVLEKRKKQVMRQINRLDMDGEDADPEP